MVDFGDYIKSLREKKGMTLEMLSEKSGVSIAQISRIESGKRGVPKPPTIKKLAVALGESYTDLMIAAGFFEEDELNEPHKNLASDTPEARFLKGISVELSDEELLQRFKLTLDGRELTEAEARAVIAYLRVHRQLTGQK